MEREKAQSKQQRTVFIMLGTAIALAAIGVIVMLFLIFQSSRAGYTIPNDIASRVLFPIYVPTKLPNGYAIRTQPQVNKTSLIFYATDATGHRIIFSEQARPKDFNFTEFHNSALRKSNRITGIPYNAIIGESEEKTLLLSVTTDDTWVIITTASDTPDGRKSLEFIARHLKEQ